jgi:hypothetical protein
LPKIKRTNLWIILILLLGTGLLSGYVFFALNPPQAFSGVFIQQGSKVPSPQEPVAIFLQENSDPYHQLLAKAFHEVSGYSDLEFWLDNSGRFSRRQDLEIQRLRSAIWGQVQAIFYQLPEDGLDRGMAELAQEEGVALYVLGKGLPKDQKGFYWDLESAYRNLASIGPLARGEFDRIYLSPYLEGREILSRSLSLGFLAYNNPRVPELVFLEEGGWNQRLDSLWQGGKVLYIAQDYNETISRSEEIINNNLLGKIQLVGHDLDTQIAEYVDLGIVLTTLWRDEELLISQILTILNKGAEDPQELNPALLPVSLISAGDPRLRGPLL